MPAPWTALAFTMHLLPATLLWIEVSWLLSRHAGDALCFIGEFGNLGALHFFDGHRHFSCILGRSREQCNLATRLRAYVIKTH